MLQRVLVVLVALLSASGPLTRGYCQLTCMHGSLTGPASAAGPQHSCHETSQDGPAIGAAAPGCGHRGEIPVGPGTLASARLSTADADHAVVVASPVVAIDACRVPTTLQQLVFPHDRSRPQPAVLRI